MFDDFKNYDFTAEKKAKLVTPYFPAQWIYLDVPNTKWKAEGEYKLTLRIPEDHPFLEALDTLTENAVEHCKIGLKPVELKKQAGIVTWSCYAKELDAETGDETGFCLMGLKTNATAKNKKTGKVIDLQPKLFDARGRRINPSRIKIGNGTVVSCNISPLAYRAAGLGKTGVTFYLNAVQIKKLVEFGGGSADQFGFGACADEDAYEYDPESFENPTPGEEVPEDQEF